MFRNYLKTAWRNLTRHKGFTLINVLGLSIGLTGCLVIGIFVWDELQFDKNIPGGENVYRVYTKWDRRGTVSYAAPVPPAYTSYMQQNYPEVETTARILMMVDKFLVEANEKSNYEEKGWFTEPSFFKIFPIKFIHGDPNTALSDPNAIVISEDMANRYFGKEDPTGKTLKIDKTDMTIRGVMAKLPDHFHLDFNYLMTIPAAGVPKERMELWGWNQFFSYVKLKPGANAKAVEKKFQAVVKKRLDDERAELITIPYLQPLKDVHLNSSEFVYDRAIRGNASYVKALTVIALFVLAIACFNFINLATARSFRRAKEIGVRKVVGADRKQLVFQFIGETILLGMISVVFATIATVLVTPLLNQFTGKSIVFNPIANPLLGLLILAAGVVIGILAGIYPALILSGFQPIRVLKNIKLSSSGGSHLPVLRQALVVVQFALSALLIVSAIIVFKQTNYLNNKDLGFNKEQIVYFQIRGDLEKNLETFKSELKRSPSVLGVTSGYGLPGDQFAGDGIILPNDTGTNKNRSVSLFIGDHDYIKTLGLRIIAGRDFSRDMATDETEAFIINETAVKEFGFGTPEKALGQPIHWNEWAPKDSTQPIKKGKVIGVVQDFHYKSLHEKVIPSVIEIYPQITFKVAVKMKTADIRNTIAFIKDTYSKFAPGYPLDYKFMDETYGKMYQNEEKLASLLWIFTIMAIVVGCMGLFGLAAFAAEQRVKEIGIRKVLGASVFNIMGLLSKNFVIMVLIASVIAFPVAWWAMNKWLQDFPYRVAISWWMFAVAAVAALVVALVTVSFQSIKAATTNPVKSLRTE